MKYVDQKILLGMEFQHPTPLKVVVEVNRRVVKRNVIERIACWIQNLIEPDIMSEHGHYTMSIASRTGFQVIQLAERVWDLTNKRMLKDRYGEIRKLKDVDLKQFSGYYPISVDELQRKLGLRDDPIFGDS